MPRAAEVLGRGLGVGEEPDGGRPLKGADPRGRPPGVHAHGEAGSLGVLVPLHHEGEVQGLGPFLREGHAEEAPALLEHEVHPLRGHVLRRHDEVALVLPVLVVHQDHGAARLELL